MSETRDVLSDFIEKFIEKDNQWVSDTIEKYPEKIPVEHLAEHFGCTAASVRSAIVQNQTFGLFWREGSKSRNTFLIPTGLLSVGTARLNFKGVRK